MKIVTRNLTEASEPDRMSIPGVLHKTYIRIMHLHFVTALEASKGPTLFILIRKMILYILLQKHTAIENNTKSAFT